MEAANNPSRSTERAPFEPLLTIEDMMAWLRVSRKKVYQLSSPRSPRPIPCVRLGREIRFDRSAVLQWLQAGKEE